jgi:hypothetical protein
MDRVEKKLIWTSLTLSGPFGTGFARIVDPLCPGLLSDGLVQSSFFPGPIWTALSENKLGYLAVPRSVPEGRLRIAQDVSPG